MKYVLILLFDMLFPNIGYASAEAPPSANLALSSYPYEAIITCSRGNAQHTNIDHCFAGGIPETTIELRNGDEYGVYQYPWLKDLGDEDRETGFHIKLRETFSITLQNSSEHMVLGLKVIDKRDGSTLFQKQVTQFGVIIFSCPSRRKNSC